MEWNLNARSDWDWEIEIPKSLAVSSHENGDYSFSRFLDSPCKDRGDVVDLGFSDMVQEASVLSGKAMIGLKLGRETYCQERAKTMLSSPLLLESSCLPIIKRSRASYQSSSVPHCQVEGCNLDLGSAKDYHRRHRICVDHSKSPKVIVAGMERRFCQQCSRLHDLSEFDERKRSCRRSLSAHNARRRRPQSEDNKFSSTYRRAHMGFLVNGVSNSSPNSTPRSSSNLNDAGVDMMSNGVLSDISSSFHGVSINHDGIEANCNSVYNTIEVGHSFSLAPTSSWAFSGRDEPSSFDHFIHGHTTQFGTSLEMQNIHNPQIPPHDFECFCSD